MTTVEHATRSAGSPNRVDVAARRLYDAEVALHIARQTRVDSWIRAAYDHLHLAVVEHVAAVAEHADSAPSWPRARPGRELHTPAQDRLACARPGR
jgi:hypothetical protein